ncbi:MAG: biotin/lipoyl-binding protein, partial [Bradyrhizobium sp.]
MNVTELDRPATENEAAANAAASDHRRRPVLHSATRTPAIIVALVVLGVTALSLYYLLRPEPLLVQGEVDATRMDIAARIDGRVGEIPVQRGQNVPAGAVLVKIDNPETLAKLNDAEAARVVAQAQLDHVLAGTRVETIAAQKAAYERAQAAATLAQKTFDRTQQLFGLGHAPQAQLDQATDRLQESQRAADQAKSAYQQAVNGATREERALAVASVQKAVADIAAVQSI